MYSENPSKPTPLYTRVPCILNMACGTKSNYSYTCINKQESPLNQTFCLVPRKSSLEGFHCTLQVCFLNYYGSHYKDERLL